MLNSSPRLRTATTNLGQPTVTPAILGRIRDATLAALASHSTDFIGMASLAGQVLFVNPAGQQILGLDGPEQAQGTGILNYVAERERERWQKESLLTVMRQGQWDGELQLRHCKTGAAIAILHISSSISEAVDLSGVPR